jgi:type I restriction enzyme S subunit
MIEETVSLGEVCEILDNLRKPITKKFRKQGQYPYYGATGIVDYVDNYIFDETLVLIGEDGAKWDKGDQTAFIVTGKYWVNNHAHVIRPLKDKLNQKFLVYYLNSINLKPWVTGLTVPKLNQEKLKSIPIPLPTIDNQQLLVAKLDEAFAEIDKTIQLTEKKIIEIEQFCAQALTSIYFDKKNKSLKKLKEIVSIKGGKRLPKGKKLTTENTGFPYIRVSDFNDDGTINLKSVKFIKAEVQKQIERYTISSKDVYVSIAGTIGKTGIVPEILENANLTENAVKLVPHESVDKEFLYFFTKTTSFKKQAIKQTRTAAQPKLALERLGKVEIPLFDLKKQIKIISEARNIILWMKLTKENCYNKIEHLIKLKSSILIQKLRPKKAA